MRTFRNFTRTQYSGQYISETSGRMTWLPYRRVLWFVAASVAAMTTVRTQAPAIGREVAIAHHLLHDEELTLPLAQLVAYGNALFTANWTDQDGGGRPLSKGTGTSLSDRAHPLNGPRSFNRISGPDAN